MIFKVGRKFHSQHLRQLHTLVLRYPDGTTQAFWREGSSGNGASILQF